MKPCAFALLLFAVPALACPGDAIPPPREPETSASPATLARDPAPGLRLGALAIELEKTTFASLLEAIGTGRLDHHGDAGESLYWVCYTWQAGGQRLWLTSGEMNGGEYIDGLTAIALRGEAMPTPACPELPARFTPVVASGVPWLGATEAQVRSELGEPGVNADYRRYSHEAKAGDFDVYTSVTYRFDAGTASFVSTGRVSTN
jgi:hypothetical protein